MWTRWRERGRDREESRQTVVECVHLHGTLSCSSSIHPAHDIIRDAIRADSPLVAPDAGLDVHHVELIPRAGQLQRHCWEGICLAASGASGPPFHVQHHIPNCTSHLRRRSIHKDGPLRGGLTIRAPTDLIRPARDTVTRLVERRHLDRIGLPMGQSEAADAVLIQATSARDVLDMNAAQRPQSGREQWGPRQVIGEDVEAPSDACQWATWPYPWWLLRGGSLGEAGAEGMQRIDRLDAAAATVAAGRRQRWASQIVYAMGSQHLPARALILW